MGSEGTLPGRFHSTFFRSAAHSIFLNEPLFFFLPLLGCCVF